MLNQKKFIVSHAPFWHDGSCISQRSYHTMIAAIPAIILGIVNYGIAALGVVSLSIASAMLWELAFNKIAKQPISIGDGTAAVIGMIFGMLLPATAPWWFVITGTFLAIIIGRQIFGGIGANPFNPVAVAIAILMISWKDYLDFNEAYVNYTFSFDFTDPIVALKHAGPAVVANYNLTDLLMGQQVGGIGSTFGLGIIAGGLYLILRGFIRWEICLSFIVGVLITALLFHAADSEKYAGAVFHLFTGYTLIGAFFLATEDSSSPVNFLPMLIYGAAGGVMTVLIRNIGAWADGVIFAILIINLMNPLLDKIRPKALGKVS